MRCVNIYEEEEPKVVQTLAVFVQVGFLSYDTEQNVNKLNKNEENAPFLH